MPARGTRQAQHALEVAVAHCGGIVCRHVERRQRHERHDHRNRALRTHHHEQDHHHARHGGRFHHLDHRCKQHADKAEARTGEPEHHACESRRRACCHDAHTRYAHRAPERRRLHIGRKRGKRRTRPGEQHVVVDPLRRNKPDRHPEEDGGKARDDGACLLFATISHFASQEPRCTTRWRGRNRRRAASCVSPRSRSRLPAARRRSRRDPDRRAPAGSPTAPPSCRRP